MEGEEEGGNGDNLAMFSPCFYDAQSAKWKDCIWRWNGRERRNVNHLAMFLFSFWSELNYQVESLSPVRMIKHSLWNYKASLKVIMAFFYGCCWSLHWFIHTQKIHTAIDTHIHTSIKCIIKLCISKSPHTFTYKMLNTSGQQANTFTTIIRSGSQETCPKKTHPIQIFLLLFITETSTL